MKEYKTQAIAPKTQPFRKEAFEKMYIIIIRWLGNSGLFMNSRGTCVMIDPVLIGFDMPMLIDMPISPDNVPYLDSILITHCDNDHFSRETCKALNAVCDTYHTTKYVAELMTEEQIYGGCGHDIYGTFQINHIHVQLTPADHAWQNELENQNRVFKFEDFCGFYISTPDGSIWVVGDSRLLDEHLKMPVPDAILFDFSDQSWHIGLDNAIKLANTYPDTNLILSHWGSVDAPDMDAFNGDPKSLVGRVVNPERIRVLAPGESFELRRI
ncbi:MBL fold metallo-hydrolase [Paenibacillus sp. GCM10028914]|uniref:MBL fold metallo-hydrolase n=1 Tax=Paenibacillus sp. GCM10028914 TaxID=3273416 RepID=UPI00360C079C